MCEVTRSNYEDLHATMIKAIQEASFVGMNLRLAILQAFVPLLISFSSARNSVENLYVNNVVSFSRPIFFCHVVHCGNISFHSASTQRKVYLCLNSSSCDNTNCILQ